MIARLRGTGATAAAITALFLPVLLGMMAFAADLARARVVRAQAQAAADAAALSATLAAQVRQEWEYVPHEHRGSDGEVWIHVHRVLVREWVEIDPDEAYLRARQNWAHHAAGVRAATLKSFDGRRLGTDGYRVEVRVGTRTIVAGALAGRREIEIDVGASARARLR